MKSQQIIEKIDEVQSTTIASSRQNNFKDFLLSGKMKCSLREQNSSMAMLLELFLLSLAALHAFITGLALSHPGSSPLDLLREKMQAQVNLYRILYSVMVGLKIILILCFYLQNFGSRYIAGLSWLSRQFFGSFSLLKEIDLALTAFLSLVNWKENVAFMVVSSVICLGYAVYLQNYVVRKSLDYATSYYDYFMLRSIVLVNYGSNILFLQVGDKQVYYAFCMGLAGFVLLWYVRSGNRLYYHTNISRILSAVVALLLAVHVKFIENLVLGQEIDAISQMSRLGLTFLCLVLFFCYTLQSKLPGLQKMQAFSVKQLDISLSKLLQWSIVSPDCEAELVGLLTISQSNNLENFYDPCLQCQINGNETVMQKQSLMRRYIKRLYLDRMASEDILTNNRNFIDYCEYLCNYDHNYCQAHKIISIVKGESLHLLDRIKMQHLQSLLQESSVKLGRMLYDGNLELQKVIKSEASFVEIQKNITKYIKSSINIWTMLKSHDVSLLEFRYLLKTAFKSIQLISEGWKEISSFFPINRRWSFIYAQYRYFIKNQRVKYKQKDLFPNATIQSENVYNDKQISFSALTKEEELYNPELVFNNDSFFLRADLEQGDLFIKAASKRFTNITGYNVAEVSGSSVSVLMCSELKDLHLQRFSSWMQKGLVSYENAYGVKTTQLITKSKASLPVFKYFKVIYNIESGLEFFCMVKVNHSLPKMQDQSALMHSAGEIDLNTMKQNFKQCIEPIQKNIFVKQEVLQPLATFSLIRYFKIASRIFLLLIISSIIILVIVSNSNSNRLNDYSNQFINYMNMYRFPVVLATNIMKNFLKVGNQTKIAAQIKTATNGFIGSSQSELTKITLFDQRLNPNKIYYPQYNYSFLANQSQSQIDLFYLMSSTITSLGLQLPVNRTGQGFQSFNSYLKPAYDSMMNTTKYRLHSQFSAIFSSCITNQQLLIYIQIGLFFLFLLAMFLCVHLFITKMKNILFIILDLNPYHIQTACQYWKCVQEHFDGLFQSDDLGQREGFVSRYDVMKKTEKTSLNKRSKQILEDRERSCFELKLRVSIIIAMVLILTISLSIQVLTIVRLKQLTAFQEAGFFFLKYFPCGPLVTMGCTEKYYSDLYPNELQFRPQKYDDALGAMYIFGNLNNYIGQVVDPTSTYFNKQKNYFFGNPCAYNPAILNSAGITVAKCESMSNGTFKEGLSSFLRYGQRLGENCIYNRTNLTAAQLDEFTLGGTVLSAYVLDAITTWVSEFASKVLTLQANNQIQCILIILSILVIHIVVNQLRTLGIINEEYSFVSRAYESLVSESVLVNEKVIRQKFILQGIISS